MADIILLSTVNAVKLGGVCLSSSSSVKPKPYFASLSTQMMTGRFKTTTSCCFREAMTPSMMETTSCDHGDDGIGIVRFLKGKSYLVTGATGFLGKVLILKLLSESPEIGKIYVLMKSKDQESANKRLYSEIISSDLYAFLKQMHGSSYEDFMKSKLIPVVGDIGEDNLGIEDETTAKICEDIDVIISCGGRTTFDDRYDSALNVNTLGPGRLLNFGKECKKLKLFLHFSTAFAPGKDKGRILETPLRIGENITSDLNIEFEVKLASEAVRKFHGSEEINKLKELGVERSQHYGWGNTYTFTKAMGESTIHDNRGDLPVVIVRPSIVESSYKEPFPGWIQGLRMTDPFILAYGKGQITGVYADSQAILDIIPVDMVVNTAIAAMAKHGNGGFPEVKVYNATSSSLPNPMRVGMLMDLSRQHLRDFPLTNMTKDLARMEYHDSLEGFTSSLSNIISKQERDKNNRAEEESHTTLSKLGQKKLNHFVSLAKIYEPYTFFEARFDDTNTKGLIQEMSMEERKMFDFDVRSIDWEHYIVNVHLPGLKRHFLKRRSS